MKFNQLQNLLKKQNKAESKVIKGLHKRAEQIKKDMLKKKP